jgi:hypothetical protein
MESEVFFCLGIEHNQVTAYCLQANWAHYITENVCIFEKYFDELWLQKFKCLIFLSYVTST